MHLRRRGGLFRRRGTGQEAVIFRHDKRMEELIIVSLHYC
jgi:hypothetical protein